MSFIRDEFIGARFAKNPEILFFSDRKFLSYNQDESPVN